MLAFLNSLNYEYRFEPDFNKRQTIEEYNKEIEVAVAEVKAGNFITQEKLEKEIMVNLKSLTIIKSHTS